jgi:oligopeptidase B
MPEQESHNDPLHPPQAPRHPAPTEIHGQRLEDDYAWLRDRSAPEVLDYLNAENAWTEASMRDTRPLQETLYGEMLSHIKETDVSVPYLDHGWLYLSRTEEGKQYPVHCRRENWPASPEHVLLDVNALAEGQPFMQLGQSTITPDGTILAYTTDNTGFRQYTLHLRDLLTGSELPDTAERVGSLAWASDSRTLFFTTEDSQTKRHDKLFRHTLGATSAPELIFEETDERFNLGVGLTRDRCFLLVESGSHTTNECRFLPADQPLAALTLIAPRVDDQEYYPDHRNGHFFVRVNDTTPNFRLVTVPVATPGRENWEELYRADVPLEDFDLFATFCVLSERRAGLPKLTLYQFAGQHQLTEKREIVFPDPAYSAGASINREFNTRCFRYSYTSLVSPASVYDYEVETGMSTLLKQQEVPGGFEPRNYASERLWVTAADQVKVPVSLVYRWDLFAKDGTNPLYVYGYGSYGYALPIGFGATRLSLLDRGIVLAYAHIRGGGELGDPWHDAGKMRLKKNTFTDFIRVVEELAQQGYGAKDRVAIEGGSAGGLLMGAVVNMAPQLASVVLSHVPFVDVMNTMLDATLPLTVAEYEEWGNPNESDDFHYMLSYSPYDNLKYGDYPAMLVKTSLNDSQVMYWEPAKYVARLRTLKQNDTPLLLHINMEAGHGGASGRYDYLKEIAFDYAFLLRELGAEK